MPKFLCWNIVNYLVEACGAQKRFKAMSPSSMTMPTTSAWEMGQGLSPYSALPPPDMQCEFLFQYCGTFLTRHVHPITQHVCPGSVPT